MHVCVCSRGGLCDLGVGGLSDGRTPGRLDALIRAVTDLTARPRREPRIRSLWDGPPVPWGRR